MRDIAKLFDSYSRVARLSPALLTSAPLVWTLCALYPSLISGSESNLIITSIIFFGGLFLLANLARYRGKIIEDKLNRIEGGWQTTKFLRHRDKSIDQFTKSRYCERLQKLIGSSFTLPTVEQEEIDPGLADEKYRSATILLKENRRDKKYYLLQKELAAYGFRRNIYGLRPVAIAVVLVSFLINIIAWLDGLPQVIFSVDVFVSDVMGRWVIYTLFIANVCFLSIWFFLISYDFVLYSAKEYAYSLFRTLEEE